MLWIIRIRIDINQRRSHRAPPARLKPMGQLPQIARLAMGVDQPLIRIDTDDPMPCPIMRGERIDPIHPIAGGFVTAICLP